MVHNEHPGYIKQSSLSDIMYRVYGWMTGALLITGATAYVASNSETFLMTLMKNPMLWLMLALVQLGLVIGISAGLNRMSLTTALTLFFVYSFLNGLTLSALFFVYTYESIALAFFITAGMFGAMSIYGYVTRADLSGMGSILFMGLIGLIIALVVNMFLRSAQFDFIISIAGVFIFTLLTAFDVQRIKQMAQTMIADQETQGKVALMGALALYLDFINLFIYLLRLMGSRRD